jgi:pyrophosphate--fructose-6-phosphate 1-phosphotransferase
MIIAMAEKELKERSQKGSYKGSFSPIPHFCGYEGRSCLPSNFDSQYCYSLGYVAALLIDGNATGYICNLKDLTKPVSEWVPMGTPLAALMTIEQRHGKPKPVIQKALVDLQGQPFKTFKQQRQQWGENDDYTNPGPIQFFGPPELTEAITMTLALE